MRAVAVQLDVLYIGYEPRCSLCVTSRGPTPTATRSGPRNKSDFRPVLEPTLTMSLSGPCAKLLGGFSARPTPPTQTPCIRDPKPLFRLEIEKNQKIRDFRPPKGGGGSLLTPPPPNPLPSKRGFRVAGGRGPQSTTSQPIRPSAPSHTGLTCSPTLSWAGACRWPCLGSVVPCPIVELAAENCTVKW